MNSIFRIDDIDLLPSEPQVDIPGLEYIGCVENVEAGRSFSAGPLFSVGEGMTPLQCARTCIDRGFDLMGVEYSIECWCTSSEPQGGFTAANTCSFPCEGDTTLVCGGIHVADAYRIVDPTLIPETVVTTATPNTPTGEDEYLGCFLDNAADRLFSVGPIFAPNFDMTPSQCREVCLDQGLPVYGLQYTFECWCASQAAVNTVDRHGTGTCGFTCEGDDSLR